ERLSSRWSTQRSVVGRSPGRRGVAGLVGPGVVQGPWVSPGGGVVHVLGSAARSMGPAWAGRGIAGRFGRVVVAASAAAAARQPPGGGRLSPGGCVGAADALPAPRPELAEVLPPDSGGAGPGGASQQRRGVHERRAADASVAASDAQSRDAGSEASVLEHAGLSGRKAEGPLPV